MTHKIECRFSEAAENDLEEIADYIASDNPRRALSFVQKIRERCQNLIHFPEAAPLREVLGPGIRMVPFGRYVIFYTLRSDVLRIERILAAARFITNEYFD